ncbi:uncharacterized protein C2845_PM01G30410 [Panicum miliaceum]|uniref:Uncharacterized protein n=1 Tax=Panicum miliaceum TaxID=4540 RepID=A0A3L6TM81_PANMI|nr:uncharacterized protein C2845_PM01G30410 [Panicum miliaceum]
MESNDKSWGRVPFGDVTNTQGTPASTCLDGKELKRQRERERVSCMTQEHRNARNKRRPELYVRKRQQNTNVTDTVSDVTAGTDGMDLDDNRDWLHTDHSYNWGGVGVLDTPHAQTVHAVDGDGQVDSSVHGDGRVDSSVHKDGQVDSSVHVESPDTPASQDEDGNLK